MPDLSGKRVTVMGLGRFGGGIGVARWLVSQGCDVLVTDLAKAEDLTDSVARIQDLIDSGAVALRLGEHNVSDFTTRDLVVASPAVPKPWANRFLRAAEAAKVPVTTEIRLLVECLPSRARTIGVTGSAGKSTTTAMIAHIFRDLGRAVYLGGNIGGSLLESLAEIGADDWVVLELSSFMLHWLGDGVGYPSAPGWSPSIAVLTNLSENHTDWHAGFSHYATSKANIVAFHQSSTADAIIHHHQGFAVASPYFGPGHTVRTEVFELAPDEPWPRFVSAPSLTVPGQHNQLNARLAVQAAAVAVYNRELAPGKWPIRGKTGAPPEAFLAAVQRCVESLGSYRALPHRLQLVAEYIARPGQRPIRFYNDSKSTTPESTLQAIDALSTNAGMSVQQIHLIAGGYDKGSDLSRVSLAGSRLAGLYAIGATGEALAGAATTDAPPSAISCARYCGTLDQAIAAAVARLRPGDALLLSPACASWDQFTNYEHRGEVFTKLVQEHIARRAGAARTTPTPGAAK
jgi:UDP-N-acetylmuramoylalanine--D-glutamate ligase